MIILPKKGQAWINEAGEQLRIKGVGRGLVSYEVPATGAVGMRKLMHFLHTHHRRPVKAKKTTWGGLV